MQSPGANPLIRIAALFYLLLTLGAVLWLALAGHTISLWRGPLPLLAGLGLGLAVTGLTHLALGRLPWLQRLTQLFAQIVGPLTAPQALLLALLSGVSEELFFRGALQASVGLVGASLVFGLAHIAPDRRFLPWTAFALVMGFALGLLYELSQSLLAPVAAHVVINAINLRTLGRLASANGEGGRDG